MQETLINELTRLNKEEKMLLVEALWDSIAADPDEVEIPEAHKIILEERLKNLGDEKGIARSWEEIRKKYN